MDNKDNDMALSKDNGNNTTKSIVQCLLQMETQTLDDTSISITSDSLIDDIDVSNESSTIKDKADPSNSEEAATENESVKESKKRLYMGRSTNDEYDSSVTKLEREIRRLRLENEKLKLINTKQMESRNKRDKTITKISGNKLHNDDDDDDDDDDEASPDDDTNILSKTPRTCG